MQQRAGDWECPNPYVPLLSHIHFVTLCVHFIIVNLYVFPGVVVTKTLLGGWSVTSAKLPNLRA